MVKYVASTRRVKESLASWVVSARNAAIGCGAGADESIRVGLADSVVENIVDILLLIATHEWTYEVIGAAGGVDRGAGDHDCISKGGCGCRRRGGRCRRSQSRRG